MRFLPSPIISIMAGKLGEVVCSAPKGSGAGFVQYLKKFVKPRNPNTAAQQAVRSAFRNSQNFFLYAQTITIGSTNFTREEFLDEVSVDSAERGYRLVPTEGDFSGRQIWIGAGVLSRSNPVAGPIVVDGLLPQDAADEPELIAILNASSAILAVIPTMSQRSRIGYI